MSANSPATASAGPLKTWETSISPRPTHVTLPVLGGFSPPITTMGLAGEARAVHTCTPALTARSYSLSTERRETDSARDAGLGA